MPPSPGQPRRNPKIQSSPRVPDAAGDGPARPAGFLSGSAGAVQMCGSTGTGAPILPPPPPPLPAVMPCCRRPARATTKTTDPCQIERCERTGRDGQDRGFQIPLQTEAILPKSRAPEAHHAGVLTFSEPDEIPTGASSSPALRLHKPPPRVHPSYVYTAALPPSSPPLAAGRPIPCPVLEWRIGG